MSPPDVSIVVPVYNEEGIRREAGAGLRAGRGVVRRACSAPEGGFGVVRAGTGSRGRAAELAAHLSDERPDVRSLSLGEPNYGKALRKGILEARGAIVIC